MSPLRRLATVVGLLFSAFALTGCAAADLFELFAITVFEDSPDPQVSAAGKAIRETSEEARTVEAIDSFVETGDEDFLEQARAVRPRDTNLLAIDAVNTLASGDMAKHEEAYRALLSALAREHPKETSSEIRWRSYRQVMQAELRMLGHRIGLPLKPRPGLSPKQQKVYDHYCEMQRNLARNENKVTYPPCE